MHCCRDFFGNDGGAAINGGTRFRASSDTQKRVRISFCPHRSDGLHTYENKLRSGRSYGMRLALKIEDENPTNDSPARRTS